MRSSNTFDRMGTITDEKIREEHMEVLPIDNEKLERLIQLYMDWYYTTLIAYNALIDKHIELPSI